MKKSEKQIHFLNRLYSNINHFKQLRARIPIVIITLLIGICGYVMDSDLPKNKYQLIGIISVLVIIGIIGLIVFRFVHEQYLDHASRIHYLWDKMGMMGEEFMKKDKAPKLNPKQIAPRIFFLGYASILIISIITILMILLK